MSDRPASDSLKRPLSELVDAETLRRIETSVQASSKLLPELVEHLLASDKYQKNLLRRLGVDNDLEDRAEFFVQMKATARYVGVPESRHHA
jgi:hypothetical protein